EQPFRVLVDLVDDGAKRLLGRGQVGDLRLKLIGPGLDLGEFAERLQTYAAEVADLALEALDFLSRSRSVPLAWERFAPRERRRGVFGGQVDLIVLAEPAEEDLAGVVQVAGGQLAPVKLLDLLLGLGPGGRQHLGQGSQPRAIGIALGGPGGDMPLVDLLRAERVRETGRGAQFRELALRQSGL